MENLESNKPSELWHQIYLTCLMFFLIFSLFSISLTQIFGLTGVAVWVIKTFKDGAWREINRSLAVPLALFLLACLIASATAADPGTSFSRFHKFWHMVIFFWVANIIGHLNPREFFLWRHLFQSPTPIHNSILRWITGWITRDPISFFVTILIISGTISSISGLVVGMKMGFKYTFDLHPSMLADILSYSTILMMISIMAFSRVLFEPGKPPWILVALGIILVALFMALSRQTWVGVFVGFLILLFFKKRILVVVPPILVLLILLFAPQIVSDRMRTITDLQLNSKEIPMVECVMEDGRFVNSICQEMHSKAIATRSNQIRIWLWKAGWQIFKDHPISGCGLSCLSVSSKDYYDDHPILKKYHHIHNNPLQIAVDTGIIGLLSWCFIWVAYLRILFIQYHRLGRGHPHQWVIMGSAGVVVGFLTSGMFENTFYDSEISMVLYFIMALPIALPVKPVNPLPSQNPERTGN